MPFKAKMLDGKWRVMKMEDGEEHVATNAAGKPADGGGHESREKAMAQAAAMNMHMRDEMDDDEDKEE